jgi:molybdate transport system ATP-binding protein
MAVQMKSRSAVPVEASEKSMYARVVFRRARNSAFGLDAEFALPAGITILFGASGAGKTTLLDALAGLVTPDSGRIAVGGRVLFDSDQRVNVPTQQRRLGYLFQDLALFPHITARQNVEYGLASLSADEKGKRSAAILERFRIAEFADRRPADISGGERQRVALARALVTDPEYLLLDEPLTALDAATKSHIIADLRGWIRDHRIPVLYVTHDRAEAYALGERVIVIENGSILAQGAPQEVLEMPRVESIAHLAGFENVFSAEVVEPHAEQGTMTCRVLPSIDDPARALQTVFANQTDPVFIESPLTRASAGERLRIGIRAGDILVAGEMPRALSARNILPARIESLEHSDAFVIAVVQVGSAGIRFEVHLTRGAISHLNLHVGSAVWLVIKTHSCHLLGSSS